MSLQTNSLQTLDSPNNGLIYACMSAVMRDQYIAYISIQNKNTKNPIEDILKDFPKDLIESCLNAPYGTYTTQESSMMSLLEKFDTIIKTIIQNPDLNLKIALILPRNTKGEQLIYVFKQNDSGHLQGLLKNSRECVSFFNRS